MKAKITKLYTKGVVDKKEKPVECWFAFDVDRGRSSFDVHIGSSGSCEAMALTDKGGEVLPRMYNAQIVGVHAVGLKVVGSCYEQDKTIMRRYYCEWWVAWDKVQE